jgi:hypothetical protein
MQYAIDLDTDGPLTIDASCATREHRYICPICGHDAFLRIGEDRGAHFAHYRGGPPNCVERAAAAPYALDGNAERWRIRATQPNIAPHPTTGTLFINDGGRQFSSLVAGYPAEVDGTYVYVTKDVTVDPTTRVRSVIRLQDFDGFRAWSFSLSEPVEEELDRWLSEIEHPLVRRARSTEADRLTYVIASAINAHHTFGGDGIAEVANATYSLKIAGAEKSADKMKIEFAAAVDIAVSKYCKATRRRKKVRPEVKARISSGNLTLTCYIRL